MLGQCTLVKIAPWLIVGSRNRRNIRCLLTYFESESNPNDLIGFYQSDLLKPLGHFANGIGDFMGNCSVNYFPTLFEFLSHPVFVPFFVLFPPAYQGLSDNMRYQNSPVVYQLGQQKCACSAR